MKSSIRASELINEVFSQLWQGHFAYHDDQGNAVVPDGGQFIWHISYAQVVGECDPLITATVFQPLLVRAVVREEIDVPLDGNTGGSQGCRELFSQVAVGEIDMVQAARS